MGTSPDPYFFQTPPPLLKLLLARQFKSQKHQEKARDKQGICGAQKSQFPELVRQVFALDDKAAVHTGESPTASQTFRDPDQKMLGGFNANSLSYSQHLGFLNGPHTS